MNIAGRLAGPAAVALAALAPAAVAQAPAWPAVSWGEGRAVDVAEFNARMPADAGWARDPLLVAVRLIDRQSGSGSGEHPLLAPREESFWAGRSRIDIESGPGERPSEVSIAVLRDGFLDDAVRGDAHRIALRLQDDGSWRPVAAERFNRCRRGAAADAFTAAPCP